MYLMYVKNKQWYAPVEREREKESERGQNCDFINLFCYCIFFFFFYLSLELIFNIQKTVDESGNYYVDFLLVFLTCMKNVSM